MYTTNWCPDCRRVKSFLTQRGISYREINIEDDDTAEEIVIKVNKGKRKVPTLKVEIAISRAVPSTPLSWRMS